MSASSAGEVMPCTTTVSSSGALGSSWIASIACALSCRKRASMSAFWISATESFCSISCTRATR